MAIERPNAEFENDLLVPPFNKRELDANAKENAQEVCNSNREFVLFQFGNENVAAGMLFTIEFEIDKSQTDACIDYLNKGIAEKGVSFTLTRENFSTDFVTLINSITGGLAMVVHAFLYFATNVICGDADGAGNSLYISAFGAIKLNNSSTYTFPATGTTLANCSINKKRN